MIDIRIGSDTGNVANFLHDVKYFLHDVNFILPYINFILHDGRFFML